MHDVPDIPFIRSESCTRETVSKRQIARLLHVSRKTVDKYTAAEYVVPVQPRLKLSQPRPAPKVGRWKPTIAAWLAEDEQAPRKQRRTAR